MPARLVPPMQVGAPFLITHWSPLSLSSAGWHSPPSISLPSSVFRFLHNSNSYSTFVPLLLFPFALTLFSQAQWGLGWARPPALGDATWLTSSSPLSYVTSHGPQAIPYQPGAGILYGPGHGRWPAGQG